MITIQNLCKHYSSQAILHQINFDVAPGEVIGLVGRSGSGKSTLLRCLHGLEKIDAGSITREGQTGLIFQNFHLFSHKTILENVIYAPIHVAGKIRDEAITLAEVLLQRMGVWEKCHVYPQALSGGQKQRVAIVRALMMEPKILLLDEPTSALDPTLVKEVINVVQELKSQGLTLVIASHELSFLKQVASRIIYLEQGVLMCDQPVYDFFHQNQNDKLGHFICAYQQQNEFVLENELD